MAPGDIAWHSAAAAESGPQFLNGSSDLLTARFRVRISVPEPTEGRHEHHYDENYQRLVGASQRVFLLGLASQLKLGTLSKVAFDILSDTLAVADRLEFSMAHEECRTAGGVDVSDREHRESESRIVTFRCAHHSRSGSKAPD